MTLWLIAALEESSWSEQSMASGLKEFITFQDLLKIKPNKILDEMSGLKQPYFLENKHTLFKCNLSNSCWGVLQLTSCRQGTRSHASTELQVFTSSLFTAYHARLATNPPISCPKILNMCCFTPRSDTSQQHTQDGVHSVTISHVFQLVTPCQIILTTTVKRIKHAELVAVKSRH